MNKRYSVPLLSTIILASQVSVSPSCWATALFETPPQPEEQHSGIPTDISSNAFFIDTTASFQQGTGTDSFVAAIEPLYIRLFDEQSPGRHKGFLRIGGMLDTDDRAQIACTVGYLSEQLAGETALSYRLLHANITETLPLSGKYEEAATEQLVEISHILSFDNTILRTIGFNVAYSRLAAEQAGKGVVSLDNDILWSRFQLTAGHGAVDTTSAKVVFSLGKNTVANRDLRGYRLDIEAGYEEVVRHNPWDTLDLESNGFAGGAELTLLTSFGKIALGFHHSPHRDILTGAYGSDYSQIFYQRYSYDHGDDEQICGIRLLFPTNMAAPYSTAAYIQHLFSSPRTLFTEHNATFYDDLYRIAHSSPFTHRFRARPQVLEHQQSISVVHKQGLIGNIKIVGDTFVITPTHKMRKFLSSSSPGLLAAATLQNGTIIIDRSKVPHVNGTLQLNLRQYDGGTALLKLNNLERGLFSDKVEIIEEDVETEESMETDETGETAETTETAETNETGESEESL